MTATIIGGGKVNLSLDSHQAALAQAALAAASAGYSEGNVLTSLMAAPTAGEFNVYDIASKGPLGVDWLNPGAQALVVTGEQRDVLIGHSGQELLIGNAGKDFIDAAAGSGTIITGNGDNTIYMGLPGQTGGSQHIFTGTGSDTINMWGGAATVTAEKGGHVLVNAYAYGGVNSVTGNVQVALSQHATLVSNGNDTISFGSGKDTVIEVGTATVTAGRGTVTVSAGAGANSVAAGSGASTLLGGSGPDTFQGGAGSSSMVGGSSANVFIGGEGHDTMVANLSASSNLFTFDKGHDESGGTHTIDNFVTGQDHIKLVGYTTEQALHHAHVVGGNTVIDLGDGTRVTLVGYTHLTATDITH